MIRPALHVLGLVSIALALIPGAAADEPPPTATLDHVEILQVAPDQSSVQALRSGQPITLAAKAPEIRSALKLFGAGDIATLRYDREKATDAAVLRDVAVEVREVGPEPRLLALGLAAAGLLLIFWLLLRSRMPDLVLGTDNRYSKSKFQMASWFFVLIATYLAATGLRWAYAGPAYIGGLGIPQNLLILSGLSALTYAGAKAMTQGRVDAAARRPGDGAGAGAAPDGTTSAATMLKIEGAAGAAQPSFPGDLLQDDAGRVDLGDFQAVVVTLLAVIVYLATVFVYPGSFPMHRLASLPDVDGTVLAAFGLGQGAYLAKKAAGDDGVGRTATQPAATAPQPSERQV